MRRESRVQPGTTKGLQWGAAFGLCLALGCDASTPPTNRAAPPQPDVSELPETTDPGPAEVPDSEEEDPAEQLGSSCAQPVREYGTREWPTDDPDLCSDGRYRVLEANLRIVADEPTEDLSALACICRIEGALMVESPSLESMAGMSVLEGVGGQVWIHDSPLLEDLDALRGTESPGGPVTLERLPALTRLDPLAGWTAIPGDLTLADLPQLRSLQGLEQVQELGALRIADTALVDLDGLGGVTAMDGLFITRCDQMQSLDGLGPQTVLPGGLRLIELPQLASITALQGVTELGPLWLEALPALSSLTGLEQLVTVRSLNMLEGFVATDLDALSALREVNGPFIMDGSGVVRMDEPAGVENVQGEVVITNNPVLESIAAIQSWGTVGGFLRIMGNESLDACHVFEVVFGEDTNVEVWGSMAARDNDGICEDYY